MARLKDLYRKECIKKLKEEFKYSNDMQAPSLSKIVLNMGVGEALTNMKALDSAVADMQTITGQKPIIRKSKKAIASFKLRKGVPVGCSVTLRRNKMYEFFDRLVNVALPRVRDFKGVSAKAFDGSGNYTLGLKEQILFPEINYDKIQFSTGMNITFVTSAKTDKEAKSLLELLGMPFEKS